MERKEMRLRIARELHKQMPGCKHDEHGSDCQGMADVVLPLWWDEDERTYPPLAEGEYIHIEYLRLHSDDGGAYLSNMVEVRHDRAMTESLLYRLVSDPDVYAIHVRRYEQPTQGVHVYDETQHLAKTQSQAYADRKRADILQKLMTAALESNHSQVTEYERQIARLEMRLEAEQALTETLVGKLVMIQGRVQRARRDCVELEYHDVLGDAQVDVQAERAKELKKATERAAQPVPTCPVCGDVYAHSEATCQGVSPDEEYIGELEQTLEAIYRAAREAMGKSSATSALLSIVSMAAPILDVCAECEEMTSDCTCKKGEQS